MSIHEQDISAHAKRALKEVLSGREPDSGDLGVLTGEIKACIDALVDALHRDGVLAVRKAFNALIPDRPWLGKLAGQPLDQEKEGEEGPSRRIRFLPDSEFENRPPREWLIPSILPKSCIAMVFGPPGCGKSFLTMAWSLCIASGLQWLGRDVMQGPVAYIAGEGSFGLGSRIKAWKYHHHFSGNSGVQWFDEAVVLQDASNLSELITAFDEDFASPPVLVVIDTLSRCSGGADENSNPEMSRVIAAADALQHKYHCAVLLVHHSGKDRDRGPRGASSLTGNIETIIEVAATDEGCRVLCYKEKDAPKFPPLSLKLQQVQYGNGEDDYSAVLTLGEEASPLKMSRSEKCMYTVLLGKELGYTEWVQAGTEYAEQIKEKMSGRAAQGAIKKLVEGGRVQQLGKVYGITPNYGQGSEEE